MAANGAARRKSRVEYRPEFCVAAQAAAAFGATQDEIADYLDISLASLRRWSFDYPELRRALKRGVDASDDRVEDSLYRLALGSAQTPANVTACIFWLKNRRKDRWRDVQQIEAALGHYVMSDRPLTEDEWLQSTRQIDAVASDSPSDASPVLAQIDEPTPK